MNKRTIFFTLALTTILIASLSFASAGYYYAPSYSDTYYKKVTYGPYEKTTEIHKDTPHNSLHYVKSERNYYGSFYPTYTNSLHSYWKYGPYNRGYYNYRPSYYGYSGYNYDRYDNYGYYRYSF